MECLPLEITIIEANDLKNVNLVSKMDVYAVLKISGDSSSHDQKRKTSVHKDCGSNPRWNQTYTFNLEENAANQGRLSLKITLKSDKNFRGDKEIGEIRVPVKELLDAYNNNGDHGSTRVTYDVRLPSGKAKGSLELSYRFGQKFTAPVTMNHKGIDDPVMAMAYPPGHSPPLSASGYGYPANNGYGYPNHPPSASNAYAPPGAYGHPQPGANGYPYQGNAYPVAGGGYSAAPGYGYPGYGAPAQGGYGYQYGQHEQKPEKKHKKQKKHKKGKFGAALGMGAGFISGLLLGEAMDAAGDAVEDAVDDAIEDSLDL